MPGRQGTCAAGEKNSIPPTWSIRHCSTSVNHLFRNKSGKSCKFLVELRPASRGFEQSLQVGYGLAADGLTKSNGFPKDKLALAWLFDISESNLPGWRSLFDFILRVLAKKARKKRVDKQLIEKYVRF